jgi:hypothetical protein
MKQGTRKNPHAVALGRLGGLVRSEAKRRANRENGRKGGLVKSRKNEDRCPPQRAASATRSQQEIIGIVIAAIRAGFGPQSIALANAGIRYSAPACR